jgi:hypothetical protein
VKSSINTGDSPVAWVYYPPQLVIRQMSYRAGWSINCRYNSLGADTMEGLKTPNGSTNRDVRGRGLRLWACWFRSDPSACLSTAHTLTVGGASAPQFAGIASIFSLGPSVCTLSSASDRFDMLVFRML